MSVDIRAETVSVLKLEPGDILHVKMGVADLGDGQVWIPSSEEMEEAGKMWEEILPEGVKAVITHCDVSLEVVRSE